jgi:hypothetical protein
VKSSTACHIKKNNGCFTGGRLNQDDDTPCDKVNTTRRQGIPCWVRETAVLQEL